MRLSLFSRARFPIAAAFLVLIPMGCKEQAKPGVTVNVAILTRGTDGKAAPQGSVTRIESAEVGAEQSLTHENRTFSLAIRKTQYGKATFDITFPNKTMQRVQVKAGEPKDILPRGEQFGVRIEVQESH